MLAEQKLKHRQLRSDQAQAIAHFGYMGTRFSDRDSFLVGRSTSHTWALTREHEQSYESWLSFIHPQDLGYVLKVTKEAEASFQKFFFYSPDHKKRWGRETYFFTGSF